MTNSSKKRTQRPTELFSIFVFILYSRIRWHMREISEIMKDVKQRRKHTLLSWDIFSVMTFLIHTVPQLSFNHQHQNKDLWYNHFHFQIYQNLQLFRCWWIQSFSWQQQQHAAVKGCLLGGSLSLSTAAHGSVSGCVAEYWIISVAFCPNVLLINV